MTAYYPTAYQLRLIRKNLIEGESITLQTDWKGVEGELGTTLDSSTWTTNATGVSLSGGTTSGAISSVTLTASSDGRYLVEAFGNFADGQIRKQQYEVSVRRKVSQ